jgi:uncharacterized protein (TIGR02246 family)
MSDDERAIREVIATWLRASAAGDSATVLNLMADDVVFLTPGRPPFGKKEFAAAQRGFDKFRIDATSQVQEVQVSGNWAYAWTELTVVMTPRSTESGGGAVVRRHGHTLSVFRKLADDRWVLARDANMLAVENAKPGA